MLAEVCLSGVVVAQKSTDDRESSKDWGESRMHWTIVTLAVREALSCLADFLNFIRYDRVENSNKRGLEWIARRVDNEKNVGKPVVYKDIFTQSFTLTKPRPAGSLVQRGEIKIVGANNSGPPRRDIAARFPIFNGDWFESEWSTDVSSVDVLGSIIDAAEPWKLPSFTVHIPDLGIMDAISFRARWLASGIWQLMQGLAALAVTLAVLALLLTLVGLVLFLLYEYVGPFLLKVLIYFMRWTLFQYLALKLIVWGLLFLNAWVVFRLEQSQLDFWLSPTAPTVQTA
ncbi:hypothetical protein B0H67DRAFT_647476 [Lasiosphaeris hirsuta]|uniref:Uncharacterized protein n=1 Tax=Lasiosphaeris hirsuta TaxID=260670 RepID=A0AA40A0W1_9PEZI|nr:hypothetical protein B0H67DRAFT_647476 [Lasiosphaeris hirsuta]